MHPVSRALPGHLYFKSPTSLRFFAKSVLDGWPAAFREMCECVEAAPSELHGRGLFARAPIAKGSLVTFYPVDALGDAQNALALRRYETLAMRDYKVEIFHGLLRGWAEDLWIDADPSKELVAGWLGHLVNDAAVCASGAQHDIERYYADACAKANCELVPFGDACPLMVIVATRDVEAGAELLQSYDHDYWTQQETPAAAAHGAAAHFERKMACVRDVEANFGPEIESLTDLLIEQLPHKLRDVEVPLRERTSRGARRSEARSRAKARAAPSKRSGARGFGGERSGEGKKGAASGKPRASKKKR